MLNKLDASNQDMSKRMDRFECNGSISSTPLTSPTIPPASHIHRANVQHSSIPTQPAQQNISGRLTSLPTESHGIATDQNRPLVVTNEVRDTIAPKVDALRSIPRISAAVSQLLANYEQQSDRDISGRSLVAITPPTQHP